MVRGTAAFLIAVLSAIVACVCATTPAATPLWQQSNGDQYGRFAATGPWEPIADPSNYALQWNQGIPQYAMSGAVGADGVIYALVGCSSSGCSKPTPQPFAWGNAVPNGGIVAVAPNGTMLWSHQIPISYENDIGLVAGGSIVAVGQLGEGSGTAGISMFRAGDGVQIELFSNGIILNLHNEAGYLFDDARSRYYTYSNANNGIQLVAIRFATENCGQGCLQLDQAWASSVLFSYQSSVGNSRPILTPDASKDVLVFDSFFCKLYRLHASTGEKVFGPANVVAFAGATATGECGAHIAANPATGHIIFQANIGNQYYVAAVFGNGAPAWHYALPATMLVSGFAVGTDAVYIGMASQQQDNGLTLVKLASNGTQLYSVKQDVPENNAYATSISLFGNYVVAALTETGTHMRVMEAATGKAVADVPIAFTGGGTAGGYRQYAPALPGINGQMISTLSWASFTEDCVPQDLQGAYPVVCSFGGVCKDHSCHCLPNYSGDDCAGCSPGYFGNTCQKCTCFGDATCEGSGLRTGSGTCNCTTGFHGPRCEQCSTGMSGSSCDIKCPVGGPHDVMCSGNGNCNQTVFGDGSCSCFEGWAAPLCDHCEVGYGGPGCATCAPGYAGTPCQPCPGLHTNATGVVNVCNGHGTCINSGTSDPGRCSCTGHASGLTCSECDAGFWGPSCEACPMAGGQVCGAQGTCDGSGTQGGTGKCKCTFPFAGPSCTECAPGRWGPKCEPCPGSGAGGEVCNGHGTCSDGVQGNGTCSCHGMYAGASCDSCEDNRSYPGCSTCPADRWGPSCKPCPGDSGSTVVCSGHGTCNGAGTLGGTGACSCSTGFSGAICDACKYGYGGQDCQQCPGSSGQQVCSGHGSCSTRTGACSCTGNFAGPACDDCSPTSYGPSCEACPGMAGSQACSGHGSCFSGRMGNGTCACSSGFGGPACGSCSGAHCGSGPGHVLEYVLIALGVLVVVASIAVCLKMRSRKPDSQSSYTHADEGARVAVTNTNYKSLDADPQEDVVAAQPLLHNDKTVHAGKGGYV